MLNKIIFIIFILSGWHDSHAQDLSPYNVAWKGELAHSELYFLYELTQVDGKEYTFSLSYRGEQLTKKTFRVDEAEAFSFSIGEQQKIWGTLSENEASLFLKSGFLVFHQTLKPQNGAFRGKWKLFNVEKLANHNFYLSVVDANKDSYQAYAYLGDNRFSGFWCGDFKRKGKELYFMDAKTGISFRGRLETDSIQLHTFFGDARIAKITLRREEADWEMGFERWKETFTYTKNQTLRELEDEILEGEIVGVNSILVSRDGKTLYEQYFNGFDSASYHDQRSATKSVAGTMMGILNKEDILKSTNQSIYELLPENLVYTKTEEKASISIKSLLTMSSGLDAIDFGSRRNSVASEENYQTSSNWTKTILEAPMINKPFEVAYYGGANPHLLGVAYTNMVTQPYRFMHEKLFKPLGIEEYIIQTDDEDRPYFGGGMHFTTRDMIKYGQMYLEGGGSVLSPDWVAQSFKKYFKLKNVPDRNDYGFLFWHRNYQYKEKTYASIEARGNGGQYIFIIPALELVVAITSNNFRNIQQPEVIMENYLLPFILHAHK
ncbi:MAG: serine hydrolase [Bacteroidota bacterium]